MRFEYKLMMGAGVFLATICIIYGFWSQEATGTVLLLFGCAAYVLVAIYLLMQWRRRQGVERPEDRMDAEQSDGAGEVGFFPAASIWPAAIGVGGVFAGIALIYGTWYWVIAAVFIFGGVIGFTVEAEAREE